MAKTRTPVILKTGPAVLEDRPMGSSTTGPFVAEIIDPARRGVARYLAHFGYHADACDCCGKPIVTVFCILGVPECPPGCDAEDVLMDAMKTRARSMEGGPAALQVRVEVLPKNDGRQEWLLARGFVSGKRRRHTDGRPDSIYYEWRPEGHIA